MTCINQTITTFLFEDLTVWLNDNLFHFQILNPTISSDSTTLYILIFVLVLLAFIEALLLQRITTWKKYRKPFFIFIRLVLTYYIALILLKYGFDKVFKGQFYLPEPNTLYTPFGQLSPDILYWSTVGTSYTYNLFLGGTEVLAAILLLFQRTRLLGLLISLVVFCQVVGVNFSFDISVKVFSCYLLFLNLLLLSPYFKVLYQFLIQQQSSIDFPKQHLFFEPQKTQKNIQESNNRYLNFSSFWKPTLKTFITGLFLLEATFPYVQRWNFNDDLAARPFLHGAYEVVESNIGTIPKYSNFNFKRFFIHRHHYLIFQNQKDKMMDTKFELDVVNQQLVTEGFGIKSIPYEFNQADSTLTLRLILNQDTLIYKGKALNWKRLPALRKPFHWSIDSY